MGAESALLARDGFQARNTSSTGRKDCSLYSIMFNTRDNRPCSTGEALVKDLPIQKTLITAFLIAE